MSTTTNHNENPTSTININPEDTGKLLGEKLYKLLGEWAEVDRETRGVIMIIADADKTSQMIIGRGDTLTDSLVTTILTDESFRTVNNAAGMRIMKMKLGNP